MPRLLLVLARVGARAGRRDRPRHPLGDRAQDLGRPSMTNLSVLPHNVAIRGNGVKKLGKVVLKGGTSTVTATLKPGRYLFYCSVAGHEAGGMKGTLVVLK